MSFISVIFNLAKKLPTCLAIIFCQFIILVYLISRKQYRKEILFNYQKIFGLRPYRGKWFWLNLSQRLGSNFGIMLKSSNNKKILDKTQIYGENILYNLTKNNQSAIIVSFHYGLWELLPQIFQRVGYETYIAIGEQRDKKLASELDQYRSQNGVKLIKTIAEMKQILSVRPNSSKRRLLGFVLDNTSKTKRLRLSEPFQDFSILRTPFVLAKLAKIPILSMFCYQKDKKIIVAIDEIKSPETIGLKLRYYVERSPTDWLFWGKQ